MSSVLMISTCRVGVNSPFAAFGQVDFGYSEGIEILSYAYGLQGFGLIYDTTSTYWGEDVGKMAVRVLPSMQGDEPQDVGSPKKILAFSGNATLTDNDWDVATGHPEDNINNFMDVTIIALVGTPGSTSDMVLCNVFGQSPKGQSQGIYVGNNQENYPFLSGFQVVASEADYIYGLQASTSITPARNGQVKLAGSATFPNGVIQDSSVDIGMISLPPGYDGCSIHPIEFDLSKLKSSDTGITYPVQIQRNPPDGMAFDSWTFLLQEINLEYSTNTEVSRISAGIDSTDVSTKNGSVMIRFSYRINIYDPDSIHEYEIDPANSRVRGILVISWKKG